MSDDTNTRSVHYRDLPSLVGRELPVSKWTLVDQSLIDRFADVTGDHQWIHVDVKRANAEIGGTIAHGFLTLSLMPLLVKDTLTVDGVARALNYGFERLRFTGTVPAGSRVRLRQTISKVEDKSGGRLVTRACAVDVETPDRRIADRPALIADWLGLFFPAP